MSFNIHNSFNLFLSFFFLSSIFFIDFHILANKIYSFIHVLSDICILNSFFIPDDGLSEKPKARDTSAILVMTNFINKLHAVVCFYSRIVLNRFRDDEKVAFRKMENLLKVLVLFIVI